MRRTVSLIISISMIAAFIFSSSSISSFASDEESCNCGKSPIVFVIGRTTVYDNPDSPDRKEIPDAQDGEILGLVEEALPYLSDAVFKGKWDEYCDVLVDMYKPFFAEYKLNNEGNVTNESGVTYSWSPDSINANAHKTSENLYNYQFCYDSRLDPCEIADDLNEYITAVKAATHHDKVALVSRCLGSNIAMAYIAEYGYEDIDTCILYASSANGSVVANCAFSGRFAVEPDALDRYVQANISDDSELMTLLKAVVAVTNNTYTLGLGTKVVDLLYEKLSSNILPRLMLESFGTTPGYWSMVGNDDDFEAGKKIIFAGKEDEYRVLIDKIDNYHYNVMNKTADLLVEMQNNGVKIAHVVKYGDDSLPVFEDTYMLSDGTITVNEASFGATCADAHETLPHSYIRDNEPLGYISPDKQIDASTCLFPDNTWFIYNMTHDRFPSGGDALIRAICRSKNEMTVFDSDSFPQYLHYDKATDVVSPLTQENCADLSANSDFFRSFVKLFRSLFRVFEDLIEKIFPKTDVAE